METKELWEILVPCERPDGTPIRTRFHRVWDSRVWEISGGLTILSPTKGKWVSKEGQVVSERMIPVRIVCTRSEILKIIEMTMEYYEQEAILAYRLSEEVILTHKK